MEAPGLERLEMTPLREGTLGDDPICGGKIMRGASFEVTLRHPRRDIRQAVGYTDPCLRQLTFCSVTEISCSPEQVHSVGVWSLLLMPKGGLSRLRLPKQVLKTQGKLFSSSRNSYTFGSYHWTIFGGVR